MQVSKKICGILKWFESLYLYVVILFNCVLYMYVLMFIFINVKVVYVVKVLLLNIFNIF